MTSVLWVSAEEPSSVLGGGNIRQANLLRSLAGCADVDLLLVGRLREDALRARLRTVIELPEPPRRDPPRWRRRIEDVLVALGGRAPFEVRAEAGARRLLERHLHDAGDHDVVIVEHAGLAPLLPAKARRRGAWVLGMQTVGSVRSEQAADATRGARQRWLWRRDVARCRRLERWATEEYDLVTTVSDDDAAHLQGPSLVVPNGVDTELFAPTDVPGAARLALTGTLSYLPNVDGSIWFCTEVLPLVREHVPAVHLDIVGRDPVAEVMELDALPGVTVHRDVPSVVPHLAAARVAVVPLRIGSGTRLKALEAMAAHRPLAGTSIGLAGLGLVDGESALIADSAPDLARAVVRLLTDRALALAIADAASVRVADYAWPAIGARFAEAIARLGTRPS